MPELGSYGSVRGARGNSRPYREKHMLGLSSSQFDPLQTRVAYCCDLLSSSRSRSSSDTKRSARCHASSLSPRNVKNFLNTTRWDVVSMAAVCASCTSVLIL